jgi:hypothetical protein
VVSGPAQTLRRGRGVARRLARGQPGRGRGGDRSERLEQDRAPLAQRGLLVLFPLVRSGKELFVERGSWAVVLGRQELDARPVLMDPAISNEDRDAEPMGEVGAAPVSSSGVMATLPLLSIGG